MLAARFFLAAWDYSLHQNRLGVRSQAMWCADLPTHRPTPLLRDNHRPVELPFCVTSSACLLPVRIACSTGSPRRAHRRHVLSIAGLGIGALPPVRKYQPLSHPLRLAPLPATPTY